MGGRRAPGTRTEERKTTASTALVRTWAVPDLLAFLQGGGPSQ